MREGLQKINSSRDVRFRQLRQELKDKDKSERLLLVEGRRQIEAALASNLRLRQLIYSADQKGADNAAKILDQYEGKLPLWRVKNSLFKELSETRNSQGVILLAYLPDEEIRIESFLAAASKPLLILENVQDPGNTGTLIRTAEAFSFAGVLMTEGGCDPYNGKALRASMGAAFRLPLFSNLKTAELLKMLTENDYNIFAADMTGRSVAEINFERPEKIALLLGNEGAGISDLARQSARLISIPMAAAAESLNVAMAGTILGWEIRRQSITSSDDEAIW